MWDSLGLFGKAWSPSTHTHGVLGFLVQPWASREFLTVPELEPPGREGHPGDPRDVRAEPELSHERCVREAEAGEREGEGRADHGGKRRIVPPPPRPRETRHKRRGGTFIIWIRQAGTAENGAQANVGDRTGEPPPPPRRRGHTHRVVSNATSWYAPLTATLMNTLPGWSVPGLARLYSPPVGGGASCRERRLFPDPRPLQGNRLRFAKKAAGLL